MVRVTGFEPAAGGRERPPTGGHGSNAADAAGGRRFRRSQMKKRKTARAVFLFLVRVTGLNQRPLEPHDKIKTGLEEAIAFERGELPSHTSKMTIQPVDAFTADDIQNIRTAVKMTQAAFAEFMGVSVKTIEAWESGRNQPTGPACRLLALTKADPHFPMKSGFVLR